jgi:UDP-glucuronate 4-epimerase
MKILLTGTRGYRPGFIGGTFLNRYKEFYDIDEYDYDIRDGVFLDKYDMVIHLAAMAGVRRSHEEPELYWDVNVKASQRLFKFYSERNVPVIYASSSSIYEWWLSPYASTKWMMEYIAPPESLGLRFHTVYGPNSRKDMLYDKLLRHDVTYITNHTRDWTHVNDVCDAIDICIRNFDHLKQYRAIDVGNGEPVSVIEMANHLWPDNNLYVKDVTGERESTCANAKELKALGWLPQYHVLDPIDD